MGRRRGGDLRATCAMAASRWFGVQWAAGHLLELRGVQRAGRRVAQRKVFGEVRLHGCIHRGSRSVGSDHFVQCHWRLWH